MTLRIRSHRRPAPDAPEHERARWWREHVARLTRAELAQRIGLSVGAISDYEAGRRRVSKTAIAPAEWRRYRLACAAIDRDLSGWDWPAKKEEGDAPA